MPYTSAPKIGAQGRLYQGEQLAQHPVIGQIADFFKRLLNGTHLRLCAVRVEGLGIKTQLEQIHQHARHMGVGTQGEGHRGLGLGKADLFEVLGIGSQHHDLFTRQAAQQHQAIETVVFHLATENPGKRRFKQVRQRVVLDLAAGLDLQLEVM